MGNTPSTASSSTAPDPANETTATSTSTSTTQATTSTDRWNPLVGGIQIAPIRKIDDSSWGKWLTSYWKQIQAGLEATSGTLGMILKGKGSDAKSYLITNQHVLFGTTRVSKIDTKAGDYVIQPAEDLKDVIGTISKGKYGDHVSKSNRYGLDCASAELDEAKRGYEIGKINGLDHAIRHWTDPQKNMRVQKYGAVTGLTYGIIDQPTWLINPKGTQLYNQIRIKNLETSSTGFSEAGDSGSIVYTVTEKFVPVAVGLLWGGNKNVKATEHYATPIGPALDFLELDLEYVAPEQLDSLKLED